MSILRKFALSVGSVEVGEGSVSYSWVVNEVATDRDSVRIFFLGLESCDNAEVSG